MKLIVWLWNPWKKYEKTRHNIWFMFLDFLISHLNPPLEGEIFSEFKIEKKFKAEISEWRLDWERTILLKPQTYMNLSGESLKKIVDFYKIDLEDIIIIYDDKDMEFWKVRFRETWSAWWHNWIKDIIKYFWKDFKRIKIWIWYDTKYDVSDWVLSNFTKEKLDALEKKIFHKALELLKNSF